MSSINTCTGTCKPRLSPTPLTAYNTVGGVSSINRQSHLQHWHATGGGALRLEAGEVDNAKAVAIIGPSRLSRNANLLVHFCLSELPNEEGLSGLAPSKRGSDPARRKCATE